MRLPAYADGPVIVRLRDDVAPDVKPRERRLLRKFWQSLPVLALLAAAPVAHAASFCGTVVSIVDGDTGWVRTTTGQNVKFRLHVADAPEVHHNSKQVDQPYGPEAAGVLASLTLHKTVCSDIKSYSWSRPVVDMTVGNTSVNDTMIEEGAAWADPRYDRDHTGAAIQADARAAHRGLWALPADQREPPWQWRKDHGIP